MSRKKKRTNRLIKKIAKRLAGYSAAAAVTVAASHGTANAAPVTYDIQDVTVGTNEYVNMFMDTGLVSEGTGVGFNFTTLGRVRLLGDTNGATYPGPWIYVPFAPSGFVGTGSYTATRLANGDSVAAADTFVRYVGSWNSGSLGANWADGDRGFVGIKFDLDPGTGAVTHYGWADITRNAGETATLHAFGYNDTPGAASNVPEPTSLLLLAAGAAGLPLWRKKKSGETA